ncbi:MAG: AAA family ATPase, partial [Planctomycetaceae bacterium]|nr:AAA family ATPase [Planctomycetaceae bacterium]
MKKLPIGVQSFEILRNDNYLYVDKTEIIYQLLSDGRVLFLSRPRRFGKSLLVSTIEALFKGQKELFEGLYIYDKWDWSQNYPVIRIDWTLIDHSTPEKMEAGLSIYLKRLARDYQITLAAESAPDCFSELIKLLHDKNGNNVVILIDEYDKPVTEHLFSHHLKPITTALHNIYQVMKGSDEYLKFIFLTGVSKFSGLSVFSALNNLRDISLNENYAAICGYTQKELE